MGGVQHQNNQRLYLFMSKIDHEKCFRKLYDHATDDL